MKIKRGRIFNHRDGMAELERFEMTEQRFTGRLSAHSERDYRMTVFSDEDLKRLKEHGPEWEIPNSLTKLSYEKLAALLVRLAAAEMVIQQSFGHDGKAFIGLDDWHEALMEWRQVSGK